MSREPYPEPSWIICSAGTGGTSATIGRYIRYKCYNTRIGVVDPENSVFFDFYQSSDCRLTLSGGSQVEGIGRPRVEPSFIPQVIDKMFKVPDAASYATIHFLDRILGRKCGGSTGTNLYGTFQIMADMGRQGQAGSVVSLICDSGDRYLHTYYNGAWLQENGYQIEPYLAQLEHFYQTGEWLETVQPA
jgi:cysteine synthase A